MRTQPPVNRKDSEVAQKRRHSLLRGATWVVAGLVMVLVPASPSFAHGDPVNGPWYHSTSSPCSNAISGSSGGGYGWARHNYDAHGHRHGGMLSSIRVTGRMTSGRAPRTTA